MLSTLILGLVTLTSFGAHASAVPAPGTNINTNTHNLPLAPIIWTGQLEKGGPNVTITGQHHEVQAKIKAGNPYWQRPGHGINTTHSIAPETHLDKRGRVGFICNVPGMTGVKCASAGQQRDYIWNHYGNGNCAVAANSCGRFSCQNNEAILMCNNLNTVTSTPCHWLGTNVQFIMSTCTNTGVQHPWDPECLIQGQAFYENPFYNVIVKHVDKGREC